MTAQEPTDASATGRVWTLRRRIALVFTALSVLAVLLIAAVIASTVLFVTAGNDVIYRWQPSVVSVQRLLTDLVDRETGVRGYVLSRNPAFLEPYRTATAAEQADSARVRQLVGGDRAVVDGLDAMLDAAEAWEGAVARPAIAAVGGGSSTAASIVDSPAAKASFDLIRSRAAALLAVVADRSRVARDQRKLDGYGFVVSLSLALVILLIAGLWLWRGLNQWILGPVDRLRRQTRVVAAGQMEHTIVGDGPSELTDLAEDVEAMRMQIMSELSRAEEIGEQLRRSAADLARSNEDLQQFAYVASHDLSEPLRKVANFCQLLERQYGPQLDDRARQYIDFAVDGAKRMQALITDLLALSRVGRTSEHIAAVDLDAALDQALRTLHDRMDQAGARVERPATLPTVCGDRSLLTSLFENLVGNAVKYRRDGVAPVVTIGVEHEQADGRWTFTVADNGIGIDPQYAERIFAVFQRLHLRDKYEGTGIGLALCRRIVEFHGGLIWLADVESTPGATFRFTLPDREDVDAEPRD